MGVLRLFILMHAVSTVLCNTPGPDRPDITMLYKKNQKMCVAGSNTQGYGLTFMSKDILENEYVYDFQYTDNSGNVIDTLKNCDFENRGDSCTKNWFKHDLELKSSKTNTLPIAPITDERWNNFYVHRTTSKSPQYEHNYTKSYEITNKFYISFSVRSNRDAQILLCSAEQPTYSSCYWILIDAFENSDITAIRKCKSGIPKYYPQNHECSELRNKTDMPHKLLSESKWVHFILSRKKGDIISLSSWDINTGARDLLTYYDNEPFSASYMFVRSLGTTADWKIHTYQYLFTKTPTSNTLPIGPNLNFASSSICISFYVLMCKKCKMIIKLETEDGVEIARSSIEGNPNETIITWRNVKIQNSNAASYVRRNILIIPSLSTTDPKYKNPFWAIDDFRICAGNEIRVASINTNKELVCQSLKYSEWTFNPNKLVSSNEPPICPEEKYIGLHCNISCSLNFQCKNNYKICLATRDENGMGACSCVAGRKWTNNEDCTESCSYGTSYGYNCNKECGKCKNRKCNVVSGECEQGCENGYQPPYCQNTFPFLLFPPIVTKVLHTSVNILFNNVTIIGSTDMVANVYLECKKENYSWYNCSNPISYDNLKNEISIKNLENETSYLIRAVVYTTNGDSYRNDDLPFISVVTTSCKSSNSTTDYISISAHAISEKLVTVKIHWKNTINCYKPSGSFYFNIIFKCVSDDWCKDINDLVLNNISRTNSEITTNKLTPFTNYEVELRPKSEQNGEFANIKITTRLFTFAAKPPAVSNATVYSKNTISISLRWLGPYPPHGLLENYLIKYCYSKFSHSCKQVKFTDAQLTSCDLWNESFKCYEIQNLYSDTDYTISIQAKNNGTDYGGDTEIRSTTVDEKPSAPLNLTHNLENNEINLYWNHPDIPNGRIRKFAIFLEQNNTDLANVNVNSHKSYEYNVTQETKHYTKRIPKIFQHASSYVVTVYAVNKYKGDNATLIIDTPPETPELYGDVIVHSEKITNTTVTLSIPGVKKNIRINTGSLYVIVSSPVKGISKRGIEEKGLKKEILKRAGPNDNSWIALEKEVNEEEITVLLGDGSTAFSTNLGDSIYNKPLEPDTEYIVTVLVMSQYKNEISSSHYTANIKTAATVSSSLELYTLLLLFLLPVIGYFAYRYGKKKIFNPTYIEPNVPVRNSYLEIIDNPRNEENNPKRLSDHEYETVEHIQTFPTNTTEEHVYETMNNLEKQPTYMNLLKKEQALMNSHTYANM